MCRPTRHSQRLRYVWSRSKRRGHTLVELLIVVALIIMLIGVLVPSISRSVRIAKSAVCKSNLQQIGLALDMYRFENGGWLPNMQSSENDVDLPPEDTVWFLKLYPSYLPEPFLLVCREDPFGYQMVRARDNMYNSAVADYASYGINSFIMSSGGGFLANLDRNRPTRPHDVILVADMGPDRSIGYGMKNPIGGPSRNRGLLMVDDGFDPFGESRVAPWVTVRHILGINVLTATGGVRVAHTADMPELSDYYKQCAAGGCTLCTQFRVDHYSFARDRLFWWTGPVTSE